jgi:branched-chain amino acid transport system ATP-binding protein
VSALSVSELRGGYDGADVVHGVTLDLAEGEVVAVVGPNGAGKSTLVNLVSGLLRPTAGRIVLHGRDVARTPPDQLFHLGLVHIPQSRGNFGSLTVRENLQLMAASGGARSPRALSSVFDQFPLLATRADVPVRYLSGGEQQMVAFARALVVQPKVLLLDEPSNGLAPLVVEQVLSNLAIFNGCAVLLVEQNARIALRFADRALVMSAGRITLAGPADQLRGDPEFLGRYFGRTSGGTTGIDNDKGVEPR